MGMVPTFHLPPVLWICWSTYQHMVTSTMASYGACCRTKWRSLTQKRVVCVSEPSYQNSHHSWIQTFHLNRRLNCRICPPSGWWDHLWETPVWAAFRKKNGCSQTVFKQLYLHLWSTQLIRWCSSLDWSKAASHPDRWWTGYSGWAPGWSRCAGQYLLDILGPAVDGGRNRKWKDKCLSTLM